MKVEISVFWSKTRKSTEIVEFYAIVETFLNIGRGVIRLICCISVKFWELVKFHEGCDLSGIGSAEARRFGFSYVVENLISCGEEEIFLVSSGSKAIYCKFYVTTPPDLSYIDRIV